MARTHRLSMTAVVVVCLLTSTVAASEPERSSSAASSESVPVIDLGESIADVAAVPDLTHATRGRFSFNAPALHFDAPTSSTRQLRSDFPSARLFRARRTRIRIRRPITFGTTDRSQRS